jgi:hypothetical protein
MVRTPCGQQRGGAAPALLPTASVAPQVLSKQLSDLLMLFPAAAVGGVQWQTLSQKYEERHRARLDIASLGHSSALAAATTLLWDVSRIVDGEDADNPVVGVEDAIALIPTPGMLACWPSLYKALSELVLTHGVVHDCQLADGGPAHGLLLSQLKQLLEMHWHTNFTESGGSFLNEDGVEFRLKKMKHLVRAVLRWRVQRLIWRRSEVHSDFSEIDEAVWMPLEIVQSKKHNDLVLCCCRPDALACSVSALDPMRRELQLPEIFDNPFEPPPELLKWPQEYYSGSQSTASGTTTPASRVGAIFSPATSISSYIATPQGGCCSTHCHGDHPSQQLEWPAGSSSSTAAAAGFVQQVAWFQLLPRAAGCLGVIPSGIVQSMRAHFEPEFGQQQEVDPDQQINFLEYT